MSLNSVCVQKPHDIAKLNFPLVRRVDVRPIPSVRGHLQQQVFPLQKEAILLYRDETKFSSRRNKISFVMTVFYFNGVMSGLCIKVAARNDIKRVPQRLSTIG